MDKYDMGLEPNQKRNRQNVGAPFSVNIGNFKNAPLHFWKGAGCSGIIVFTIKNIYGGKYSAKWMLFIRFVTLTSNPVYSVVWNQSIPGGVFWKETDFDFQYRWYTYWY